MLKKIILLVSTALVFSSTDAAKCPGFKDFKIDHDLPSGAYWRLTDEAIHSGWQLINPPLIFIDEEYTDLNSMDGENQLLFPKDLAITVYLNRTNAMHSVQCFYKLPAGATAEIDYVGTKQIEFNQLDDHLFHFSPRYVERDEIDHPIRATIDTFSCDLASTDDTDLCSWEWAP